MLQKWDEGREYGRVGGKYDDDGYGCAGCKYYRPVPDLDKYSGVRWRCTYGGYGCIYK